MIKEEEKNRKLISTNVPDQFYEQEPIHTGYNAEDRRDQLPLQAKGLSALTENKPEPDPKAIRDAQGKIITPKGREIDPGNPLHSLAPDVWDKMEQEENERAERAERRSKARQSGQLISDAIKSLIDVVGERKGAYNTPRTPERIDFSELDKLDADHSAALQRIRKAKMDDALAAAREAGRDIDRGIRAQEVERKKKQGDDKFEFEKYKFPIVQKDKKDEGEANRQSREKIAKMRKPTTRVQTPKKEEGSDATYNYSVPLNYRNSPNYNRLNPDQEGSVNIKGVHVARFANEFANNYPQKMAELKAKRMKLDPNSPTWAADNAAIKGEESRLTNINDIAKRLATGGGKWNEADVTTILDETMRPDNYLELINQTPTKIESEPLPTPKNPVIDFVNKAFNGQRVNVTPNQTATPPAKPTAQTQTQTTPVKPVPTAQTQEKPVAEQPYRYHNASLNAKPGSPEHSKAVVKVAEGDYRSLTPEEMQDKAMYRISNRVNQYNSKYGKNNQSPMAQDHREKMSIEIFNELKDYWANQPEFMAQLEKLAKKRSTKGEHITVDDLIMDVADDVANGKKPINKIL